MAENWLLPLDFGASPAKPPLFLATPGDENLRQKNNGLERHSQGPRGRQVTIVDDTYNL